MENFDKLKEKYEFNFNEEEFNVFKSHLNGIKNFYETYNGDWEEEPLDSNEVFGVTFNFEEWIDVLKKVIERHHRTLTQVIPSNIVDSLIESNIKIANYVDGFLLEPVGLYKGNTLTTKTFIFENFDDIIEYLKQIKEKNNKIFLYIIYIQLANVVSKNDNYVLRYAILSGENNLNNIEKGKND